MTFLSVVLITLACVAISYCIWNYCRQTYVIRQEIILPGPKKYMTKYLNGIPDELLNIVCTLGKYFSSPFKLWLNEPFVVIYEPNQVKTVLKSQHCLDKNIIFYKFAEEVFGTKLLTVPESIWNQNQKRIASSFSPNMLQGFFSTFVKESLTLTNKLEKIGINGNEIIFLEHIATCALDIACSTIIGTKMESNKKDQYFKAVARLKEILRYRVYSIWNNSLFDKIIFNFTTLGREQQKTSKLMHSLINEIIQQQLHELNKLHKTETKTNTNKTFFNNLMESFHKKNFTQEMIRDNVITMITLASDKIAITTNFVVFMLANFPEIQEKVYKELVTIYGTKTPISAPVKYDDLQYMHYLDQVIEETMRLFPTIPIIGRRLTEDVKIGDSIIPKSTSIIIVLMLMNRQEQYWPNPLKFDPDRFLPERIKDCPSDYHVPFSDGPRICTGTKYAMISMKVTLATLIRTFVFKVDKSIQIRNIKLKTDITLSTIESLKIRIKKRDL